MLHYRLPHRKLVCVEGKDAIKFLQALVPFDMRYMSHAPISMAGLPTAKSQQEAVAKGKQDQRRSLHEGVEDELITPMCHTAFLNHRGRVMFDAFVSNVSDDDWIADQKSKQFHTDGKLEERLLLDVDASCVEQLLEHFAAYKLRNKININVKEELSTVALVAEATLRRDWSASLKGQDEIGAEVDDAAMKAYLSDPAAEIKFASVDPRFLDRLDAGYPPPVRAYVETRVEQGQSSATADFHAVLAAHGVGEGPSIYRADKTLPFEANLDYLDGVSFNKGCYLGQELTHRARFTLVTRKRLMPVWMTESRLIDSTQGDAASDSSTTFAPVPLTVPEAAGPRVVGNIVSTFRNVGLAVLRFGNLGTEGVVDLPDGRKAYASTPPWWPRS